MAGPVNADEYLNLSVENGFRLKPIFFRGIEKAEKNEACQNFLVPGDPKAKADKLHRERMVNFRGRLSLAILNQVLEGKKSKIDVFQKAVLLFD